ncbi:MAG: hypothetical protein GTO51_02840 [Candidatus Latescibacteria bacterium]|nr:hypothetical protein [Candidatus Latescibacterota bacterium]NIM22620.1 hypothetical protein [Candidatus Latescibacterota bacterium]NIM64909.1 hypothetical protein [Candidatus Latescibacterota bacterium]NIO01424.1 hypothetical protein [Candidatus Latescibacterota bacterium]NIO27934.1 hypothetical protein [Candidatus Latescibacterota bacterium]
MRTYVAIIAFLLLLVPVFSGCILDPREKGGPPPPDTPWPSLKEKDNVFPYLKRTYEGMDYFHYEILLDEAFIFRFGVDDVGGDIPESWDRTKDLASTKNMLTGFSVPEYGAITNFTLILTPEGPWIEVPKTEPPYEGEIWYQRTVEYTLIVTTTKDYTLQGLDLRALFIVRYDDNEEIWRIVQWNDDI